MLAKMTVAFSPNFLTTDVTHGVSTITYELVAAARLDEAEIALWAGPLDTACSGSLDGLSERL